MAQRFIIKQKLHNNDVVNRLHYVNRAGLTAMSPLETAQEIADAYAADWAPICSSDWSLVGIDYYDTAASAGTPAQPMAVTGLPIVGALSEAAMANQVATLINWITADGPPWRGKTYLAGMGESNMGGGGAISTPLLNAADALISNLLEVSSGTGFGMDLAIWSPGTDNNPGVKEAVVASGQTNIIPATQKNRKIGVGS